MAFLDSHPQPTMTVPPAEAPAAVRPARARLPLELLGLVRPAHWAKSVLVVPIALLDTPQWGLASLGRIVWSILAFILASSAVYVGNDIADRHRDRHHPVKRHRAIAAGRVSVPMAVAFCAVLCLALALFLVTGPAGHAWPVLGYLLLNVAYSRGLKHLPLIEAGAVATGFVLRAAQGYVATGSPASGWLLATVFTGCLLLIIGKRRQELLEAGTTHRPALRGYSVELAGHLLQLTGGLTMVSGLLYVRTEAPFDPYGQPAMLLSMPFALFAIARYLQIVLVHHGGSDPVRVLLGDRALKATVALGAATLTVILLVARFPAVQALVP
jgi:4-hydroxybenzoate polyprenyltransferase